MDTVLSYHMNPLTCGVARFNRAVSDQFDLPMISMFSPEGLAARRPMLSFKVSEMTDPDIERLGRIADDPSIWPHLRLFFHDYSGHQVESKLIHRAEKVYCGNEALYEEIRALTKNAVKAWCPGYLFETRVMDNGAEIKLYTFGMAHKLRADYYYRLKDLLDATGKTYRLYISAAIHEGTSLDDSFTAAYEELRSIFGDSVYFLGFISDASLYSFLKTCTYFAAFFRTGVRANNSSVSTAMQCGAVVLTNLDDDSPPDFAHMDSVIDIRQCTDGLPLDPEVLRRIGDKGRKVSERLGWDPLLDLFIKEEVTLQRSGRGVYRP